jgi:hypothetical protein
MSADTSDHLLPDTEYALLNIEKREARTSQSQVFTLDIGFERIVVMIRHSVAFASEVGKSEAGQPIRGVCRGGLQELSRD